MSADGTRADATTETDSKGDAPRMPGEHRVRLTVNAREEELALDPETPLILALRNDLGLTGVRAGCAIGECGACTVILDGEPVRSCITPLGAAAGTDVVTPEGLGTPEAPHPVQQAFLDEQAAQCGYCTNGLIMTVAALYRSGAGAGARIREALTEQLCRCGAHLRVLRAVDRAVAGATGAEVPASGQETVTVLPDEGCSGSCGPCGEGRLPSSLAQAPGVESWLSLLEDGRVEVRTGKVELGQGLRTALAQIVATQIGLPLERIVVLSAATDVSPDERYTAGSRSIEDSGGALAFAAVAFRRLLLARAAARLEVQPERMVLDEAGALADDGRRVDWAGLHADGPVAGLVESSDRPHWHGGSLGLAMPRPDLEQKLTGAPAYVHDLQLPGMVHARVALPPTYDAALDSVDLAVMDGMPGLRRVVSDGRLLLAVADREEQARNAATRLRRAARWRDPGLPVTRDLEALLRDLPARTMTVRDDAGLDTALASGTRRVRATYQRPYHAHAAMAPSCAVAEDDGTTLTVWTHSQGVYPLRRELATLLGVAESRLDVRHVDGPGCYGHNGADDAAAFAALAARSLPGVPVRFQFTVEEEFAWEPYGSAMLADLEASLDDRGCITGWRHSSRTDVHASRPDGTGDRLVASWLLTDARPRPWTGPRDTGSGNVVPLYSIPLVSAATDFVQGPLRASALRSLASFHNVFAGESFMDELAEAAGRDPVAFRLAHLRDERARRVLEVAAEASGWVERVGPSGRGKGIAVCRYKETKAYVAQAVDVSIDGETGVVTVDRVVLACDAGVVVNPDGLRNQLEGGTLQGLSRALYEEVGADAGGITSRDWTTYPVLRFGQVPAIEVILVDRPDRPPLGVGESATPPVVAALANAIDDALGVRFRRLPFSPSVLQQRLMDLGEDEMARCLL
jgi:nicotinate dehydrogenase subunit B